MGGRTKLNNFLFHNDMKYMYVCMYEISIKKFSFIKEAI